jgi:hypothetical protein
MKPSEWKPGFWLLTKSNGEQSVSACENQEHYRLMMNSANIYLAEGATMKRIEPDAAVEFVVKNGGAVDNRERLEAAIRSMVNELHDCCAARDSTETSDAPVEKIIPLVNKIESLTKEINGTQGFLELRGEIGRRILARFKKLAALMSQH